MMSATMSCVEAAGFGGSSNAGQFVMAGRTSGTKWQLLQYRVRQHAVIRKNFLKVIDEAVRRGQAGGKKCNVMLAVETVHATTSKTSAAPKQYISVFESAPVTPDQLNQKGQKTLSSRDDFVIKGPGFFKELPLNPVTWAGLLLIFFSIENFPFGIQILEEDYSEEAIPEMIIFVVFVFVIVQQMEGTNHLGPNLLRDVMQMATSKQFLSTCSILGLMSLSGAQATDSTEGIKQSGSKEVEKHDLFKTAAWTVAAVIIASAAAWRMFRKRRATSDFRVLDEVLGVIPLPRRSNPDCKIHPAL